MTSVERIAMVDISVSDSAVNRHGTTVNDERDHSKKKPEIVR